MIELLFQNDSVFFFKFNDFPNFTVFDIVVSFSIAKIKLDAVATLMSF